MGIESTPATEAPQGLTEEQGVAELLNRWKGKEPAQADQPETEETTDETPSEQPKGDAGKEESVPQETEESEDEGETEIDVAGEKFKVPAKLSETAKRIEARAKEVEAGATRKFQEAADLRKAAEVQHQTVKQLQKISEAQADLIADHRMVARRLSQLDSVDINSVDTETLTRLNAEYNQLQAAKGRIEGQYTQNIQAMQAEEQKAFSARKEHAEKLFTTHIKGWSADKAKSLSEYAKSKGAPDGVLQGVTDAWMVQILDDAAYGHAMRTAKGPTLKRVEVPTKTLKPGAAGSPNSAAQAKVSDAMKRLQKSGRLEDAAAALLARSAFRKR
jgi:hypothetical protein